MSNNKIKSSDAQDALQFTQKIIDKYGPRLAGEPSTKKAAYFLKDDFETFCNSVEIQEFDMHPNVFLGWIKLVVIIYTIDAILLWFNLALIAAISITFAIIVMVLEFFLYYEFVDIFWKKKKGYNVIGKIEPEGEVKQQVILSGHHDSAYIFNFFIYQPKLYSLRINGGLGFVFLLFIFSWIWGVFQAITGVPPSFATAMKYIVSFSLVLVGQLYFFRNKKGTPGAGDNLISVSIASKIGKIFSELKKNGNGLKNTRLIIASWDGEECGLRGARAFVKKYKTQLKSIPTFNFNIDGPYLVKELFFLTTDVNCSVKLSEEMAIECKEIAEKLGFKAEVKPIEFLTGGTDAGEFGRIGVEATTLIAMPWGGNERYDAYHTPKDKVEAIEPEMVEIALKIAYEYISKKDRKG